MNALLKKCAATAFSTTPAVTTVHVIETVRILVEAGALPTLKGITDKDRKGEVRAERKRLMEEIFVRTAEIQRQFPAFNLEFVVVRPSTIEGEAREVAIHSGGTFEEVYKKVVQAAP